MDGNRVSPPAHVIVALGANQDSALGAPRATLTAALELLAVDGVRVSARARWRRTPAFPAGSGPDFVNGAALLTTDLPPEAVLARLHDVERRMGRKRRTRWAPRVCDLDLIAYGARIAPDEPTLRALMALGAGAGDAPAPTELILPHPRMQERSFVLAPVADIAPDWRHPLLGATVAEMLAALPAAARDEVEAIE